MYGINPENGLEPVIKSGAFWVRRNALLWSDVEPQQGQRNWGALAGLENEMKNASHEGLNLILISTQYSFLGAEGPRRRRAAQSCPIN